MLEPTVRHDVAMAGRRAAEIDDPSMITGATDADEWAGRVVYLPLR
jgi:hypothetical protein